jgi:hypothetical protein
MAFSRRLTAHAYEATPLDVEAVSAVSLTKRTLAANTIGFAALGRGDRDTASKWFRKIADLPPIEDFLQRAIRERVISDPNWPLWLKEKN